MSPERRTIEPVSRTQDTAETWGERSEHQITIVETMNGSARWKCSCGATMGGQWARSAEEAVKRGQRHLKQIGLAGP